MTADDFRAIALSFPGAAEGGHMGHADFRRDGKIFATLGSPDESCGMVKLTPEEQAVVIAAEPAMFAPANGSWGRSGSTLVRLRAAGASAVTHVLELGWAQAAARPRPSRRPASRRTSS